MGTAFYRRSRPRQDPNPFSTTHDCLWQVVRSHTSSSTKKLVPETSYHQTNKIWVKFGKVKQDAVDTLALNIDTKSFPSLMKSPLFLNFQNSTTAILKVMIASLSWSDLKLDILVKKIRFQRKGWFQERNETQSLKYWKYFFGTRNIDIKPAWLQILFRNTFEDLRICCSEYKGFPPNTFQIPNVSGAAVWKSN